MYGGSEERSGRHGGSSRHGSGWDRDGDYHRSNDDYWMDGGGGGTHYDRGTRDYERGSRQPDRKRGAEYFMQEARRRKHEADKIGVSSTIITFDVHCTCTCTCMIVYCIPVSKHVSFSMLLAEKC